MKKLQATVFTLLAIILVFPIASALAGPEGKFKLSIHIVYNDETYSKAAQIAKDLTSENEAADSAEVELKLLDTSDDEKWRVQADIVYNALTAEKALRVSKRIAEENTSACKAEIEWELASVLSFADFIGSGPIADWTITMEGATSLQLPAAVYSYPLPMKSTTGNDLIVWFTAPGSGIVINKGSALIYDLGHKSDDWDINMFEPLPGFDH